MIALHFFVPKMITQIFNPVAEVVIPKGIPTNEAKEEIETQPVEAKVKKVCIQDNLKS